MTAMDLPQMLARLDALCPELAFVVRSHIAEIDPTSLERELEFLFTQASAPQQLRVIPAPPEVYVVAQRAAVADSAVTALTDILDIAPDQSQSKGEILRQVKDIHATARTAVVQANAVTPQTSPQVT